MILNIDISPIKVLANIYLFIIFSNQIFCKNNFVGIAKITKVKPLYDSKNVTESWIFFPKLSENKKKGFQNTRYIYQYKSLH